MRIRITGHHTLYFSPIRIKFEYYPDEARRQAIANYSIFGLGLLASILLNLAALVY